jgi:copper homeostasis protein
MLEIACFNASSAVAAAKAGADRIELCADYAAEGVTPSFDALQQVKKSVEVPVHVMIRPRGDDFNYNNVEFQKMKTDIERFKPEADGFVFGILDAKYRVDEQRSQELVELAAPLLCTFHRAFDQVPVPEKAVKQIINCGFKSILTSGGLGDAEDGAERVAELQEEFGSEITFILGGGVRSKNVEALRKETNVEWFHSSAITKSGEDVDEDEVAKLQSILKQQK